jgi:hypothetical protein
MYELLGIDTVLRIAAALALLFIAVPALSWGRPATFSRLEWFWWNLGAGITLLTLFGQLFTLLHIAGPATYILLLVAIVIGGRARRAGVPPLRYIADAYGRTVLFSLHVLDQRVSVRDRAVKLLRGLRERVAQSFSGTGEATISWAIVIAAAALTRFYRPFATANLGYSDTYAHLYLMRLLDQGQQVDPSFGPYPRGMHFLMLAVQRLTNVDEILMMNFFGAFSGVLITVSVAYAARRVTRTNVAAVVAGLLFAMMMGGARQYFAFGGSIAGSTKAEAEAALSQTYDELLVAGEFDVMLSAFLRQTSTLPQELAIVLLFPASLFLLDWLRTRDRWRLAGFIGCTSAIAAVHSGVLVPLVFLCAAAALASVRQTSWRDTVHGALAGAAAIAVGSTWMLAFLRYRNVGSTAGSAALYYFPFLRPSGEVTQLAYMMLTPFLLIVAAMALILAVYAWRARQPEGVWLALGTLFFTFTHASSVLGVPELIEARRNVTWLAMCVAATIAVALTMIAARLPRRARVTVPALGVLLWCATLPNLYGTEMRDRVLDYSGYGATTEAVLRIARELEPFTWTLVSYGQEYPMVLGRGFHINAADFVEQYDPTEARLRVPTPRVFIAVEKTPHRFEIDNWSKRFGRAAVEERLQTWCSVYGLTHRNMRVWLDDEHVRVYEIVSAGGAS